MHRKKLLVTTTVDQHEPEDPNAEMDGRPRILLVAEGALIIGQQPFLDREHELKFPLGVQRTLWHDGDTWRITNNGWGDRYAMRVLRWPEVEVLDTSINYTIQAPPHAGELVAITPASGEPR